MNESTFNVNNPGFESEKYNSFRSKLEHLINCESVENGSNTPDFILAEYLTDCLKTFDKINSMREAFYGRGNGIIANSIVNQVTMTIPMLNEDTPGNTEHHIISYGFIQNPEGV